MPAAAGVAWHICIALLSVLLRRIFERQFYPGAYRLAPPRAVGNDMIANSKAILKRRGFLDKTAIKEEIYWVPAK